MIHEVGFIVRMKRAAVLFLAFFLAVLAVPAAAEEAAETKTVRIIATSDLHGKMVPWDYALNEESRSGSMAQLSAAIKEYRTENTLLVDAGDTIQDNAADTFVGTDGVHPMVQALNAIGYDVWVTGNHEYNYGMDVVRKTISDIDAKVLTGNVYDEKNEPVADGYAIFTVDGVRVAVIGMVTPNIAIWDSANLKDCRVTDPLDETRKIIDKIKGQYDVLVAVFHMSVGNEYGVPHSGAEDILKACPEFDVCVSAHEHLLIPSEDVSGVLVVQNKYMAQTMSVIDLTLVPEGDGWKVAEKTARSVSMADYEPDPAITELLAPYHEKLLENAGVVIGKLAGDAPLSPQPETEGIPPMLVMDTALSDLINGVQMHYADAEVSATAIFTPTANLQPGDIHRSDLSLVYRYANALYKVHMTGAQLKKYMEWSAGFYNTYQPGDLTVSFNKETQIYNYDIFEGVNYEINIAREPGNRIENLTWPDGRPVADDDEFDIAVNDYRAKTHLICAGEIYGEDDHPTIVEADIRGDLGGVRELIGDYIVNVNNGEITAECNDSWRITGNDWDEELHRRAVELAAAGEITVETRENAGNLIIKPITADDLP